MSQLVRLRGTQTAQCTHCAVRGRCISSKCQLQFSRTSLSCHVLSFALMFVESISFLVWRGYYLMCSAKLVKCTQVVLSVYEVNVVHAWCAVCSVQPGCLCSVQVIVCGQHSLFSKGACAVCRHLRCVFLSSSSRLPTLLQPHCALLPLLLNTTTKTVFGSKHIFFLHWTKPPGPSPPPAFTAWASYPTSQSTSPSSQPPSPSSQPLPPPSLSELHCPISKAQKNSTTTRCALEAESAPFEGVVDETIAARNHSPGGGADRDGQRKQEGEKKVF